MGTLLLYKPSLKVASKILEFFRTNKNKDFCSVGIGDGKAVVYQRKDMPRLEALIKVESK